MLHFLTVEDILYIHREEIRQAGTKAQLIDPASIEAIIEAPKATFDNAFLYNVFEMATAYIVSTAIRHPFSDGNKRVALASALTFLTLNGWQVTELYETELADAVLALLKHEMSREALAQLIEARSSRF
jgi:death-on-curing protein